MSQILTPFTTQKRRGYLIAVALAAGTALAVALLGDHGLVQSPWARLMAWLSAGYLLLSGLALALRLITPTLLERLVLGLASLLFVGKIALELGTSPTPSLELTFSWAPLIWVLCSLVYGPVGALAHAACLLAFSALLSLAYAAGLIGLGSAPSVLAGLLVFHLVSATLVAMLFILGKVKSDYLDLERFAEEWRHKAHTDALTGIPNRRFLERLLDLEIMTASATARPLSLMLLDIDHFKQVNDRYGHHTGDALLRALVDLMRANLRAADHIGRWGGEEFMIIAPGTDLLAAGELAERLRSAIEVYRFPRIEGPITVSFGVATLSVSDSKETLTRRADRALYKAKRHGRNRVWLLEAGPVLLSEFGTGVRSSQTVERG
jgi:diguanylate cyclase (GGDEF)-like protein